MSEDDGHRVYITSFDASLLRQPTNMELAEYIDTNNMMWFTAMKCVMTDRDILHTPEELEEAVTESKAAYQMVMDWWRRLVKDE